MIFRFIAAEKANHSIALLCEVLEVSRSGFHAWQRRPPSRRAGQDAALLGLIEPIHRESRRTYGSPRVHAELRLDHDVRVGRKRVERLMREAGLSGMIRRRRGKTTIAVPGIRTAPDLVERGFNPTEPNRLWCADITYVRTWEGWLYLASVMDCFSRRIVGWALADHLRAELVDEALAVAIARRQPAAGLVHHSDQGSQGGFKWSSQRSIGRSCDGPEGAGVGACGSSGDAVAGASAGGAVGASAAVLGCDRAWRVERGRCGGGRRVGPGRRPVVSGGWRNADRHARRAVGTVSVLR